MSGKKKSSNLHIFLISWKKSWNLKCKFKHGFPQFYVKKQYFLISCKKGYSDALEHLLHFEICACEICEKFVYIHSEREC